MSFFRRQKPVSLPVTPKLEKELERTRAKRILVVGSEGHGEDVTSYAWDKFPKGFNVADFDVLILNFAAFEEDPALAAGLPPERLPTPASVGRFYFAEKTELIAIGDPTTQIGPEPDKRGVVLGGRSGVADPLPFWFQVEHQSGSNFEVKDDEWHFYLAELSGYEWFLSGETGSRFPDPTHFFSTVGISGANGIHPYFKAVAVTRFGKPIAMEFRIAAVRIKEPFGLNVNYGAQQTEVVATSSPAYWLPSLRGVSAAEAVDLILAERFQASSLQRRPEWSDDYSLPVEEELAAEIAELESKRAALDGRIAEAHMRAEGAGAFRALLYERGKDELEPIVRAALRILGAEVREPDREGIEDGLLVRPGQAGILEIKGRKDQIRQSDVRQVVQWASDAKLRDGAAYKPIIVGNPHCATPPSERGDPLAPNALTYARNGGVVLLTTVQIFEALQRQQVGDFDPEAFWLGVFAGDGPVKF